MRAFKQQQSMSASSRLVWILAASAALAVPAVADDCAAVRSAILDTGHKPQTTTTTTTDAQGKPVVTRTVQTVTDKYVQTKDGKWYSMGIAIKDLNDNLTGATMTCRRSGGDIVNGESTAVYEFHLELEGMVSENKIWVSSKNLVLKADMTSQGRHYTTMHDFSNATPPANATVMGGKPSN